MSTIGRDEIEIAQLVNGRTAEQLAISLTACEGALSELQDQRANDRAMLDVAYEYFRHRDLMNSAVHLATVRWSPITLQIAAVLGVADELEPHPDDEARRRSYAEHPT